MAETRHRWIIDSIEEQSAAVEVDGQNVIFVPVWMLPTGVQEGDVLSVKHDRRTDGSTLSIEIDPRAKAALLERSKQQVSVRSKNDKPGDITL